MGVPVSTVYICSVCGFAKKKQWKCCYFSNIFIIKRVFFIEIDTFLWQFSQNIKVSQSKDIIFIIQSFVISNIGKNWIFSSWQKVRGCQIFLLLFIKRRGSLISWLFKLQILKQVIEWTILNSIINEFW